MCGSNPTRDNYLGENMKSFIQILNEATYIWDINPSDRAWFISIRGEIIGGASHRSVLKKNYAEEYKELLDSGEEPAEIDEILENRLIKTGSIKIGKLKDFYACMQHLNSREKDAIQGFCNSYLKVNNKPDSIMSIQIYSTNTNLNYTFGDIANDCLFSMN
jgi:hypothetical protein